MSVYKTPKSRFYQYDFRFEGRRFHGSTGVETLRKAEAVERQRREEAALRKIGDGAGLTLNQAAGRWWLEKGRHLSEAQNIERRIGIVLRLIGKDTRLVDISTRHVATAMEKRRGETYTRAKPKVDPKTGKTIQPKAYPVTNATVNNDIIITLSRILGRARKVWEVKGLNEIDWQELRLPEPAPKVRWYSAQERAAWLGECDEVAAGALRLLFRYGLRLGEVMLPPQAYDASGPRLVLNDRKGDNPHTVPLRREDAEDLAARAAQAKLSRLKCLWFEPDPKRKGRLRSLTYYGLQSRLRSAARRAKIDGGRLIHGARHHAGTDLLRNSNNLKLTQQLLGHKDIKSTMRYAHALEADLRAALEGGADTGAGDAPKNAAG